jgi:DNA-binding PadR family transcriptional regulator
MSIDNASDMDIVARTVDSAHSATPPAPSRNAMLILLAIGPEERHGYSIMREVQQITGGATRLGPGAVYTTIKSLLVDGLIEESAERPDPELDDQRRRYYRLTGLGRAVAAAEARRLQTLVNAVRPWALEAR